MVSVYLQGMMERRWDQISLRYADIPKENGVVQQEAEFVKSYNPILTN